MSKKFYFLAPTRDSPPDGPIALGNIIATIAQPEEKINENGPPAIPEDMVNTATATNWRSEKIRSQSKRGGVWAGFLEVLGVGAGLSTTRTNFQTDAYEFDKLTTTHFVPTRRFVEEAVADPDVKNWMKYNRGDPLFMITGIKVASGAKFLTQMAKERGFRFQLGVNASAFGVPIQAGPDIETSKAFVEEETADAVSDFVFAFRVKEIRYKKKTGVMVRDYNKGAMYGLEDAPLDNEEKGIDFEVDRLAEEDPKKERFDFDFESFGAVGEDESPVECIVPEGFFLG